MKKILFATTIVCLLFAGDAAVAQTANLNITLSDVLSFSITQPAALDVDFDTESKYNDGITAVAPDHISVTSSRGYIVKAIAGTVTGTAALAPGSVKITASVGASNAGNTAGLAFESDVVLPVSGGSAATILTAANSSWDGANSTNKFDVSYLIGADGVYAGKATGANVIPVTYSVTQP